MTSLRSLLIALSALFWPLLAMAFQPQDICGTVDCSPAMQKVAETFLKTEAIQFSEGRAYAGVCYYITGYTTPDYPHAGLAVFSPTPEGLIQYRGLFSFFGRPMDYAGMTYEQALEKTNGSENVPTLLNRSTYSGYQSIQGRANLNYWFGLDPATRQLSLLSVWLRDGSISQVAFCQMDLLATEKK